MGTLFSKTSKTPPEQSNFETLQNVGGRHPSTSTSEAENDKYVVRPGTIDRGKEYEYLVIGHLALSLVLDDEVNNFKISSNDKRFAVSKDKICAFDDVVVEIEKNNETEKFAIQVKYTNEGKCLTTNALEARQGDFAIRKYFNDYVFFRNLLHDFTLVIFTNYKFDNNNTNLRLYELQEEHAHVDIQILEKHHKSFLKNYPNEELCHSFDNKDIRYEEFFDKFFLYANQVDADTLEDMILKKFQQEFQCSKEVSHQYIEFIKKWNNRKGKKEKLSKRFLQQRIALLVLSPHIQPFPLYYDEDNSRRFRRIFFPFNVTFFDKEHADEIKELCAHNTLHISNDEKKKVKHKYHINTNEAETNKILWLMNLVPLVVFESENTYKAINLCPDKKFIILGTNFCKDKISASNICEKLSDFEDMLTLGICRCSIEGGSEISLKELLEISTEFKEIITTNELIQMLRYPLSIGKEYQIPFYIDRLLITNIVKFDYLNKIGKDTLVIISCDGKFDTIKNQLTNMEFVRINSHQNLEEVVMEDCNRNIYVFDETCDFNQLCQNNVSKNRYHHFRVRSDGVLEWLKSKGDIQELRGHILEGPFIEEWELPSYEAYNNINIICSIPGMGKTELMERLKKRPSSIKWTILISVRNHAKYFKNYSDGEDGSNFLTYILNQISKNYNDFELKCLNIFKEEKKVRFFWDGLDEVAEEIFNNIKITIHQLSQQGYTQWITSTSNMKSTLENEFKVIAKTIKEIGAVDQKRYIENTLPCRKCNNKILQVIAIEYLKEILKIPSELLLFTKWLCEEHSAEHTRFQENISSIADIYSYIIKEKIDNVLLKKCDIDENALESVFVRKIKEKQLQFYETAALGAFLEKKFLENLPVKCDSQSLQDHQEQFKMFGIVTEITTKATFLHDSYGEYFAARYFKENKEQIKKDLKEFIFEAKYDNIRFFFDLFLAKNSPLHVAVLYKMLENLEIDDHVDSVDQGGRTILHLLCSWGQRFQCLSPEEIVDRDNDEEEENDSIAEEKLQYDQIMTSILFKIHEVDQLFNLSPLAYGDRALCLLPVLCLLENHSSLPLDELRNFNVHSLRYYSEKFGYGNVKKIATEALQEHVAPNV